MANKSTKQYCIDCKAHCYNTRLYRFKGRSTPWYLCEKHAAEHTDIELYVKDRPSVQKGVVYDASKGPMAH